MSPPPRSMPPTETWWSSNADRGEKAHRHRHARHLPRRRRAPLRWPRASSMSASSPRGWPHDPPRRRAVHRTRPRPSRTPFWANTPKLAPAMPASRTSDAGRLFLLRRVHTQIAYAKDRQVRQHRGTRRASMQAATRPSSPRCTTSPTARPGISTARPTIRPSSSGAPSTRSASAGLRLTWIGHGAVVMPGITIGNGAASCWALNARSSALTPSSPATCSPTRSPWACPLEGRSSSASTTSIHRAHGESSPGGTGRTVKTPPRACRFPQRSPQ